jgi:hypothetical protein
MQTILLFLLSITSVLACVCNNCDYVDLNYGQYYTRSYTSNIINHIDIKIYFANSIIFFLTDYPNYVNFQAGQNFEYSDAYSSSNTVCFSDSADIGRDYYNQGLFLVLFCNNVNGCGGYFDFTVTYLTYEPTRQPSYEPTLLPTNEPTNEPIIIAITNESNQNSITYPIINIILYFVYNYL